MQRKKSHRVRAFLLAILIALCVAGIGGWISYAGMPEFRAAEQPKLTPPEWVFPVVWSVLFLLMGISSALVYLEHAPGTPAALAVYGIQLFLNLGWTVLFFGFHLYFASSIWILALLAAIAAMIVRFLAVRPVAGYLQIPYLLWVAFATYLTFGVYLLN